MTELSFSGELSECVCDKIIMRRSLTDCERCKEHIRLSDISNDVNVSGGFEDSRKTDE